MRIKTFDLATKVVVNSLLVVGMTTLTLGIWAFVQYAGYQDEDNNACSK